MRRTSSLLVAIAIAACGPSRRHHGDGGSAGSGLGDNDAGSWVDGGIDGGPGGSDAGSPDGGPSASTDGGRGKDAGMVDAGNQLSFSGYIYDYCNNRTPLAGVLVAILDGGASTYTDTTGNFVLPAPLQIHFTPRLKLTGYNETYLPELDLTQSLAAPVGLTIFCDSQAAAMRNSLTNPSYDPQKGLVFAAVQTLAQSGPCTDQSGWQFSITPDGGESIVYLDQYGFLAPAMTATGPFGFAIIYNVAASRVFLNTNKPDAGPDGGNCTDLNPSMGVTGYGETAPGIVTIVGRFIQ